MHLRKTKNAAALFSLIILFVNPLHLFAGTLEDMYTDWRRGNYQQVVNPAFTYFQTVARKKKVAYWLGTSLCRTNQQTSGIGWLTALEKVAIGRQVNIINEEIQNCSQRSSPAELPVEWVGSGGNMKDMEIKGNPLSKIPSGSFLFESDGSVSEKALARRLIDKANAGLAISSVKYSLVGFANKGDSEITDDDYSVENVSRRKEFDKLYQQNEIKSVLIGDSIVLTCVSCDHTKTDLEAIGHGLESYITLFSKEFGMRRPEQVIKIYAATNDHHLQNLAKQLHGVHVGLKIIGYSIAEDMSMVIILPFWDTRLYGTSKHELFHLMIKDDFGDAPPWIEEGMAALYEGSEIRDGRISGIQNWREAGLRKNFHERLTVEQLVELNWARFNYDSEFNIVVPDQNTKTAALHAMARYFILYLEKKGKLAEIYKKMREIKVSDSFALIKREAKTVLEESLGMSIEKIDKDFEVWFRRLPDITIGSMKKIKTNPIKKLKPKRKK